MASRRFQSRIFAFALSTVLFLFVFAIMCRLMGDIAGEELSPQTFERREFRYYEIPLIHVQIYPIKRVAKQHELADWIRSRGLVPLAKNKRWDLASVARHGNLIAKGDAKILSLYFDSTDEDGRSVWLAWSEEHPKLAAALWPRVSMVAQQGLYVFIPDLMTEARRAKTADELTSRITASLVSQYRDYALKFAKIGDHESAVAALTEALKLDSEDAELYEARARSLTEVSKAQAAQADLQRAAKLKKAN